MGSVESKYISNAEVSAKIIKADGTVIDLGVIARSPALNKKPSLLRRIKSWLIQRKS